MEDQTMSRTNEVDHAMRSIDEDTLVPRLLLFAHKTLCVPAGDVHALVWQSIAEILQGHHHHHFSRHVSTFHSLCAVLKTMLAAQREPKRGMR
jgi:hypothetical protein